MTNVINYAHMKALINNLQLPRVQTKQCHSLLAVVNDQKEVQLKAIIMILYILLLTPYYHKLLKITKYCIQMNPEHSVVLQVQNTTLRHV